MSQSDSWLVGFSVWGMHRLYFEKHDFLGKKTIAQHLIEKSNLNANESIIKMIREFINFIKNTKS